MDEKAVKEYYIKRQLNSKERILKYIFECLEWYRNIIYASSHRHAWKGKNGSSHSSHRHRKIPDRIQAGRAASVRKILMAVTKWTHILDSGRESWRDIRKHPVLILQPSNEKRSRHRKPAAGLYYPGWIPPLRSHGMGKRRKEITECLSQCKKRFGLSKTRQFKFCFNSYMVEKGSAIVFLAKDHQGWPFLVLYILF